ncbi:hypothetical protein BD309DRAFT_969574, partial [Dichomitus squalens]
MNFLRRFMILAPARQQKAIREINNALLSLPQPEHRWNSGANLQYCMRLQDGYPDSGEHGTACSLIV